jgi:hypothetical protein
MLLLLTALAAGAATGVHAQQQFLLFLSLLDANGNPPAELRAEQVQITEGGASAEIVRLERIDWPIKVQVLVDNGIGLGAENLLHIRNGIRSLMKTLPTGVEASLYTTAPQPRVIVAPTNDRFALMQGADRIAPDGGGGRYIESMNEATRRIEQDTSRHFPVIISVATAIGDTDVRERDVESLWRRLQMRPTTVHTVLLASVQSGSSVSAANQTQVGLAVKELTGGRYENIAAGSRLATLLPEIGEQVAASHHRQSRQFMLTVERPEGITGPLGAIGGSVPVGYTATITADGAMP